MMINHDAFTQFDELQMEGKPDIVIEVIDSFLKTSKKKMDIISSYANKKDTKGAAREAHGLKPGAMILGATQIGEYCQKIEDLKESNDTDELLKLIKLLEEIYLISCNELIEIKSKRLKMLSCISCSS